MILQIFFCNWPPLVFAKKLAQFLVDEMANLPMSEQSLHLSYFHLEDISGLVL